MKWVIPAAAALSICFVTLHAQQPGPSAHSTKILTGCLRNGTASETYKLTDATPRIDVREQTAQPVGTSGQKVEYDVTAERGLEHSGPPVDLKAHVNHQVKVTVRPAETAVAPSPNPGAETADVVKPTERKPARVIVTDITSLSSSCS